VAAGGMVTSTSSGLSVPDWPTTYGYSMFSFPLRDMAGGIFYEHGHRLIASTVGFLTVGLAVFIWLADPRRSMRRLGLAALGAVILQGVLGGMTVLFRLPAAISIAHAGLAQIFFCLTVSAAACTSEVWLSPAAPPRVARGFARWTTVVAAAVYVQILLGATMRHLGAGLAIPDFPLAFGHLIPPMWDAKIAIHFAHRVGAATVTLLILAVAGHVFYHHAKRRELVRPAILLLVLVSMQV